MDSSFIHIHVHSLFNIFFLSRVSVYLDGRLFHQKTTKLCDGLMAALMLCGAIKILYLWIGDR